MTDRDLLKRDVFNRLMDISGRVFLVVRHADSVIIGHRGFMEDEKQNGITLVFNQSMHFIWDDAGISATLSFGSTAEKCVIPTSEIIAIYSPEAGVQMVFDPDKPEKSAEDAKTFKKDEAYWGEKASSPKDKPENKENKPDKPDEPDEEDKPDKPDKPDKKSPREKVIRVDFHKRP